MKEIMPESGLENAVYAVSFFGAYLSALLSLLFLFLNRKKPAPDAQAAMAFFWMTIMLVAAGSLAVWPFCESQEEYWRAFNIWSWNWFLVAGPLQLLAMYLGRLLAIRNRRQALSH